MSKRELDKYNLQSVTNALRIIEALTDHEELNHAELAEQLNLSKSAIYRLLSTLEQRKFVVRSTNNYVHLGYKMAAIGAVVYNRSTLIQSVHPFLVELSQRSNCYAVLALMNSNNEMAFVDKYTSRPLRITNNNNVDVVVPHLTAHGKAVLAHFPHEPLNEYMKTANFTPMTANSIDSPEKLWAELAKIRQTGYSIDREEADVGAVCFAMPILNPNSQAYNVEAAIGISNFRDFMYEEQDRLLTILKETVDAASEALFGAAFAD